MKIFYQKMLALAGPYFKSPEKKIAWTLLVSIMALTLGQVFMDVQFNKWHNAFYDTLQDKDKGAFATLIVRFCWMAAIYIIMAVYQTYLTQMLQIRWRRWMTRQYIDRWLSNQTYYRLQVAGNPADNPDQRIADDIGQFINLALGLSLGLLNAAVTVFSFLFILWSLSGDLQVPLWGGNTVTVPGYLVWVALVYSGGGTWITWRLGRPLVPLNFEQQRYEANFRFSLVRFRENTESIAFFKGEVPEREIFLGRFSQIFDNFWNIMRRQKRLSWFTSGYGQIANIFPYLVVAPRYFSGAIKLGALMQTGGAFGQVQRGLSFFIDAFTSIATWRATIDRLEGFNNSMSAAESIEKKGAEVVAGASLSTAHLNVSLPLGEALLRDISFEAKPGESLLIQGPSGCGKSTLLRTIAGIWPFAEGTVTLPQVAGGALFIPQKPYMPLGTLRQSLLYPNHVVVEDDVLTETLKLCALSQLTPRLDEVAPWSHMLSLGEQQRVAFFRALVTKPGVIFLDEATSALDEEAEQYFYKLLRDKLPEALIVSVGHRSSLKALHSRTLTLPKRDAA